MTLIDELYIPYPDYAYIHRHGAASTLDLGLHSFSDVVTIGQILNAADY